MIPTVLLFLAALWLAYANGANDNMKGVATLLGSGTTSYRGALWWGTAATFAGSIAALLLAGELVAVFSGRGVVPDALVGDPGFLFSAGSGAVAVVMSATLAGLPVSTTHALTGGLAGAGLAAVGPGAVAWDGLARAFALPLLLSPFLAWASVGVLYPLLHRTRRALGVEHDTCLCAGAERRAREAPAGALAPAAAPATLGGATGSVPDGGSMRLAVGAGAAEECAVRYRGRFLGIRAGPVLDACHYASAGAVSFARGLNDTPKIAALLLAGGAAVGRGGALAAVGFGMAVGALLQARRVGYTMSFEVTAMNAGQGFTANLVTAALVVGASRLGMPVSTTHVSVGSLFGLGTATGGLVRTTFGHILLAWVATLPAALVVAWLVGALL